MDRTETRDQKPNWDHFLGGMTNGCGNGFGSKGRPPGSLIEDWSGRSPMFLHRRLRLARQPDHELAVFADLAVHSDAAAMLLRHDVIADRQAETGALRWKPPFIHFTKKDDVFSFS